MLLPSLQLIWWFTAVNLSLSWSILLSSLGFWNKPLSWFFRYLTGFSFTTLQWFHLTHSKSQGPYNGPQGTVFLPVSFLSYKFCFTTQSFPSFLPFWLLSFLGTGHICSYLRAFALAAPPRMHTWIAPLLPPGFYSSYTMCLSFQLSLCSLFYFFL